MSMEVTWLTDDTVRIQNVIRDFDDSLLQPDSHEIKIWDALGSIQGTISTVGTVGTGTYRYDYVVPSDGEVGDWKVSWKALSGTYPAREIAYFKVSEG